MSVTLALNTVSAAIYAALNVAAVTALASGPFDTVVPQGTAFPYVWFTVNEEQAGGMGSVGVLGKVNVRVYAASNGSVGSGPAQELGAILDAVRGLLEDHVLTFGQGFQAAGGLFYSDTPDATPEVINGVPCWTRASNYYGWVEA